MSCFEKSCLYDLQKRLKWKKQKKKKLSFRQNEARLPIYWADREASLADRANANAVICIRSNIFQRRPRNSMHLKENKIFCHDIGTTRDRQWTHELKDQVSRFCSCSHCLIFIRVVWICKRQSTMSRVIRAFSLYNSHFRPRFIYYRQLPQFFLTGIYENVIKKLDLWIF